MKDLLIDGITYKIFNKEGSLEVINKMNHFLNRILITHKQISSIYHSIHNPDSNKIADLINNYAKDFL